jgi:hypothetical protein
MNVTASHCGARISQRLRARQEGFEFSPDDVVEDALFGAMSRVGALRAAALRVRRMWSVDRLRGFLKDHLRERLPGTCRSANASNARESALPGKLEAARSRRSGSLDSPASETPRGNGRFASVLSHRQTIRF